METTTTGRLQTLRNRYERLIAANWNEGYIHSEKATRYLNALQSIKTQIWQKEAQNREANKNSEVSKFLRATKGMSGFQILRTIN